MRDFFERLALLLLCVACARCTSEIDNVPASTQLTVRIDAANEELRRSFDTVRIALFTQTGEDSWEPSSSAEFARQEFSWPLELPVLPKDKNKLDRAFEVIVQALDGERVLAEARAVTRFAPKRHVLLSLYLERCGGDVGVCELDECHGSRCESCRSGRCMGVAVIEPKDLPDWNGELDDDELPASNDGGAADAKMDGRVDAAREAAAPNEAGSDRPDVDMPGSDACTEEGALRCGATSGTRQRCTDGMWQETDACPTGQVCNPDSTPPGACRMLAPVCVGNPGQTVCDGNILTFCNQAGEAERPTPCPSVRHCELGKAAGKCAVCLPGQMRCTGARLEKCADDQQAFTLEEMCPSAALCNSDAASCGMGCTVGSKTCAGDELRVCGPDRVFTTEKPCMPGLCDMLGQQCDTCVADSKMCMGNSVVACKADGQGTTTTPCAAPKRLCRGNGVCVECASDTDCTAPAEPCMTAVCNVAMGVCETKPKASGMTCGAGFCDGQGNCGECRDGQTKTCGSDVGRCATGTQRCTAGRWGACTGGVQATAETCNNVDDDCDDTVDDGAACSGGLRCIAGRCAQCGAGAPCPTGQSCNASGTCETACGNGRVEPALGETCDPASSADAKWTCHPRDCKAATYSTFCTTPSNCRGEANICSLTHTCVAGPCTSSSQCLGPAGVRLQCLGGECRVACSSQRDCPDDQFCEPRDGVCKGRYLGGCVNEVGDIDPLLCPLNSICNEGDCELR